MKVSDLYGSDYQRGPIAGRDVYIVGSGPSLSVFPYKYLEGRCCVLLNDVQKFVPKTIGPVAFANNKRFLTGCECPIQIVKGRLKWQSKPSPKHTDNHVPWDDPRYYVFSYREHEFGDKWSHFDEQALWAEPNYYWNVKDGNVSIFAMQFAALAGAKSITLVGCDCSKKLGRYLKGKNRETVRQNYEQYAAGTMRMMQEIESKFGIPVVQCNPFAGYGREHEQYNAMLAWRNNRIETKQRMSEVAGGGHEVNVASGAA